MQKHQHAELMFECIGANQVLNPMKPKNEGKLHMWTMLSLWFCQQMGSSWCWRLLVCFKNHHVRVRPHSPPSHLSSDFIFASCRISSGRKCYVVYHYTTDLETTKTYVKQQLRRLMVHSLFSLIFSHHGAFSHLTARGHGCQPWVISHGRFTVRTQYTMSVSNFQRLSWAVKLVFAK